MSQDRIQQERATRAQGGSRRKRDLRAAGMSDGPDTTNARSEAIWDEQRAWVNQHLDVPENWIPLFMMALGRARRGGVQNPSREQLVAWLERNGWPVEELSA